MTIDSAAEPQVLFEGKEPGLGRLSPYCWTPDGRSLVYVHQSQSTGEDIGLFDVEGRSSRMLLTTTASENKPQISPDGRWLAYASNQSGRFEVNVTDMATASLRRQVSTDGGNDPVWSRDSRELFFLAGTAMMATSVSAGTPPTFSRPVKLFDGVESGALYTAFSVSADGRFLLTETPRPSRPENHVTLVLNGLTEITRRLTTP